MVCSQGLAPAGSSRWWLVHCTSVLRSYHRHRCRWDNTVSSDHSRYRFHLHGLWGWTWHWHRHAAQSLQEEWQCKGFNRNMPSQRKNANDVSRVHSVELPFLRVWCHQAIWWRLLRPVATWYSKPANPHMWQISLQCGMPLSSYISPYMYANLVQ